MMTWRTNSYTPPWFMGKALPTANSQITASLELIDAGKIINLSGQKVYWYVDDELIGAGIGLQKITFNAPSVTDNILDVRAEIPGYNPNSSNPILKTIEIPIINPEAVIESPYPGNQLFTSSPTFKAWPFFFNTQDVTKFGFTWTANGATSQNTENPDTLVVNIDPASPSGFSLGIGLTIQTSGGIYNSASKNKNLVLIK